MSERDVVKGYSIKRDGNTGELVAVLSLRGGFYIEAFGESEYRTEFVLNEASLAIRVENAKGDDSVSRPALAALRKAIANERHD